MGLRMTVIVRHGAPKGLATFSPKRWKDVCGRPFSTSFSSSSLFSWLHCGKDDLENNILSDFCESSLTNWKWVVWPLAEYTRVTYALGANRNSFFLTEKSPSNLLETQLLWLPPPTSFSLSLGSDRCPNRLLGKPDRRPQSQRQQKSLPLFHPHPASTTISASNIFSFLVKSAN